MVQMPQRARGGEIDMDNLLSFLEKFFDQVNLGRALIYTGAGLLFVLPIFMLFEALFCPGSGAGLEQDLLNHLKVPLEKPVYLLIGSYVFGLIVVTGSYPIIDSIQKKYMDSLEENKKSKDNKKANAKLIDVGSKGEKEPLNVNYHFINLAQKGQTGTREPLGWLITEYFRFVEAALYLPMGILGFFAIFSFYFAAQIPNYGLKALIYGAISMGIFLCLFIFFWFFWLKKVVEPAVFFFQNAKLSLIKGLLKSKSSCFVRGHLGRLQ